MACSHDDLAPGSALMTDRESYCRWTCPNGSRRVLELWNRVWKAGKSSVWSFPQQALLLPGLFDPQRRLGASYHEQKSTCTWLASGVFCTISTSVSSALSILGLSAIPGLSHEGLDHSLCHHFLKFPCSDKLSSLAGSLNPHKVSMEITSDYNVSNKDSLERWCFSQM